MEAPIASMILTKQIEIEQLRQRVKEVEDCLSSCESKWNITADALIGCQKQLAASQAHNLRLRSALDKVQLKVSKVGSIPQEFAFIKEALSAYNNWKENK